jgi:hypothetical protein
MLIFGIFNLKSLNENDTKWSIWSLGFGDPSSLATVNRNGGAYSDGGSNPFILVLYANTPQLILSLGYVIVNSLLTEMLAAWEWSKIGRSRTKLRTTCPKGQQRSMYFLQLPYKYSLPLLVLTSTLHYLVSMSIFVVNVTGYSARDENGDWQIDTDPTGVGDNYGWALNYSPMAIIFTVVISALLISLPIILSFRNLHSEIPVVGSCSALISAVCHPPPEEGDAGLLPVQWGVLQDPVDEMAGGHCTISSAEVSLPVDGQLYS